MKTRWIIILVLLPLLVVAVLAILGIILKSWVYLALLIVCPAVAGIVWYIYGDVRKKVSNVKKEIEESKKEK